MQVMSFTVAMLTYFGKRPNTTNMDFMKELKDLTPEDRAFFIENLPSVGFTVK